jgi:hypothetical protein
VIQVRDDVFIYACIYIEMYMYVCMYVCMYMYVYMYMTSFFLLKTYHENTCHIG